MARMKLYADGPVRRTRQMLGDVILVLWVLLWLKLANVVHDATLALAAPGRKIEEAGSGLAGRLRDAGSAVGDLPLVGDKVRSPFDGAGKAADQIAAAGLLDLQARRGQGEGGVVHDVGQLEPEQHPQHEDHVAEHLTGTTDRTVGVELHAAHRARSR